MQREYINFVNIACKEGMKPEEVQDLFNHIYSKSNTKQGKRILRLFAKGIGKVKKNSLTKQQANQKVQSEKSFQYVYK